jgi:polyisoprenoid-binding protein YceI
MTRNRSLLTLAAVLVIAVGGFIAYDQALRGDDTVPLALQSPTADAGATDGGAQPSTAGGPVASGDDGAVAGTWIVGDESIAGYRVREQLANLPAESDAVGRTSDVTGSITLTGDASGAKLTEATLTVDTTTIASDEGRRDDRLRTEGLETDRFPTATFVLTGTVDIAAAAIDGTPTDLVLVGDLTLHGVTRSVEIPAQAQLADGRIQVAGSITFPLADFDIAAPNVGGFILSIADEGALEFLVSFSRG